MPSLRRGGALAWHRLVSAASSSEPPTSVGLAHRPVGAWRRQLVKRSNCTATTDTFAATIGGAGAAPGFRPRHCELPNAQPPHLTHQMLHLSQRRLQLIRVVMNRPAQRVPRPLRPPSELDTPKRPAQRVSSSSSAAYLPAPPKTTSHSARSTSPPWRSAPAARPSAARGGPAQSSRSAAGRRSRARPRGRS